MRFFAILFFGLSLSLALTESQDIGSPSNAASQGTSTAEGISDGPTGTTEKQEEEFEIRPSSMGGAPNKGAGMGTGTGAGSKVGNDIEEGTISAGATSGEEEE